MSSSAVTLSVALMVRNEERTIARALASVRDLADEWVVLDTGSTDATLQVLREVTQGWAGQLHQMPWSDFSTCRNALSALVRTDWVLYLDADQELVDAQSVRDELAAPFDALRVCSVEQPAYWNPRLVRGQLGTWRGRTHEALHLPGARMGTSSARVLHHGDGGTRAGKLERDEQLLRKDLADLDTARTRFYLGSTLLGLGRLHEAAEHLTTAQESGWGEERYVAAMTLARVQAAAGDLLGSARQYARAAASRPGRFEAAFEAVRMFNRAGLVSDAARVGSTALSAPPRVGDVLFVHAHARTLTIMETTHALLGDGRPHEARTVLADLDDSDVPLPLRPLAATLRQAAADSPSTS